MMASMEATEQHVEFGFTNDDCCGLTEECVTVYLASVRTRFDGRWTCGLYEVMEGEICRSVGRWRRRYIERQVAGCLSFRSAARPHDVYVCGHFIFVVKRLMCRILDLPRARPRTWRLCARGFYVQWICVLHTEVVEEEISRSAGPISMEEAMHLQTSFCLSFRKGSTMSGKLLSRTNDCFATIASTLHGIVGEVDLLGVNGFTFD